MTIQERQAVIDNYTKQIKANIKWKDGLNLPQDEEKKREVLYNV